MAIVTRRYKLTGPANADLTLKVGASAAQNTSFPVAVVDVDVDDAVAGSTTALDEFMAQFGFVFDAAAVPSVPFATADKSKLDGVSSGATNTPLASTTPADTTKAAAAIGVSTTAARSDHKHDISTAAAAELTDSTNAEGSATSLARSDHTHAHGTRGGGNLHADATPSVAGFMSAADKLKLDGISGGGFALADLVVFDHFQGGNVDADEFGLMGWRIHVGGTGPDVDFAAGVAGHPGIVRLESGTTAAARAAIALGDTVTGGRIVVGGNNPIVCEAVVRLPDATSVTNTQEVTLGLGLDWDADVELADGIYFRYTPGTDTFWSLVCASGGVRTVRASGTIPVAGNWVRLGFSATATSVTFLLNGVAQGAAITTNIPTIGLGFGAKNRANGVAESLFDIDYVALTQVTDKET
jgi:hypothetical protein